MKKTITLVRILLGVIVLVFGLNGFLQFMPSPAPSPEMGTFLGALSATGYIFPLISTIEIVAGGLLLANKATPLALILLSPIIVNAFLAHLLLHDIGGIGPALIVSGLMGFLIYAYRKTFYELLKPNYYDNA